MESSNFTFNGLRQSGRYWFADVSAVIEATDPELGHLRIDIALPLAPPAAGATLESLQAEALRRCAATLPAAALRSMAAPAG